MTFTSDWQQAVAAAVKDDKHRKTIVFRLGTCPKCNNIAMDTDEMCNSAQQADVVDAHQRNK